MLTITAVVLLMLLAVVSILFGKPSQPSQRWYN
jgi:hypothetical protein